MVLVDKRILAGGIVMIIAGMIVAVNSGEPPTGQSGMSEEEIIGYELRKEWDTFWLVDPLDGTKDFIAKNGGFTVNIALIKNHKPILGVVTIPVTQDIYYAELNKGAYKNGSKIYNHSTRKQLIGADSNFYSTQEMQDFFKEYNIKDIDIRQKHMIL